MAYSDNLKFLREKRGMTQPELAEQVGVTQASISKFESGEIVPNVVKAVKIGKALKSTCEEMVDGTFAE